MTIGMLLGPKHAHDDVATVHEKRRGWVCMDYLRAVWYNQSR